jgi:UDP-N-acetylglucosamine--N-acetylmuramyl-(pentapeptide) pyrophosphoryl-undecaprenol N-acetylglucosamine transferase
MIISCGGTGGHFYPGLSIARECKEKAIPVRLYVAGMHSKSQQEYASKHEIEADIGNAIRLPAQKWKLPYFALIFFWTTVTSFFYLLKHRPKAILVMGSFASVPLGLAAVMTFTPLFLHEGNTVTGRANRLLSRFARELFLSFPIINEKLIQCPMKEVGMPIRPEIENCQKENTCFKEKLGVDKSLPLLMVFGGSQGALKINNTLYESLSLIKVKFQLLHLTGQADNNEYQKKADEAGIPAQIITSTDNMAECYMAADLLVCRAGASSLAEIAFFGKPVVFIPLKIAAENHQFHNAEIAKKANAAEIILEDELTPESLSSSIELILKNNEKALKMSENMAALCRREVAQTLVKTISSSC